MTKICTPTVGFVSRNYIPAFICAPDHVHPLSTFLAVDLLCNIHGNVLCNVKGSGLYSYMLSVADTHTIIGIPFYSHLHVDYVPLFQYLQYLCDIF